MGAQWLVPGASPPTEIRTGSFKTPQHVGPAEAGLKPDTTYARTRDGPLYDVISAELVDFVSAEAEVAGQNRFRVLPKEWRGCVLDRRSVGQFHGVGHQTQVSGRPMSERRKHPASFELRIRQCLTDGPNRAAWHPRFSKASSPIVAIPDEKYARHDRPQHASVRHSLRICGEPWVSRQFREAGGIAEATPLIVVADGEH